MCRSSDKPTFISLVTGREPNLQASNNDVPESNLRWEIERKRTTEEKWKYGHVKPNWCCGWQSFPPSPKPQMMLLLSNRNSAHYTNEILFLGMKRLYLDSSYGTDGLSGETYSPKNISKSVHAFIVFIFYLRNSEYFSCP